MASALISRAQLPQVLALAGAVCLFATTSQAGEKIHFSDRQTKMDLPVNGPDDLKQSSLLDFLSSRRSEMGAPDVFSFTPPRLPRTARDKQEQERLAEKKKWILQDAESLRGDPKRKGPTETQFEDEPGKERKNQTLMERFIEERERKSQASTNQFNHGFRSEIPSLDFSNRQNGATTNRTEFTNDARSNSEDSREQKGDARPSARLPANARNGEAEFPRSNGAGPSGLSLLERAERAERLRQQEDHAAELRRLLDSPGTVSAAPRRGVDLLSAPDATRQEINPTLGRGLNDSSLRLDLKKGFDPQGTSSRPSILDEINPSGFGSPGGEIVPLFRPPEPIKMERRPTVLEIPKRRI